MNLGDSRSHLRLAIGDDAEIVEQHIVTTELRTIHRELFDGFTRRGGEGIERGACRSFSDEGGDRGIGAVGKDSGEFDHAALFLPSQDTNAEALDALIVILADDVEGYLRASEFSRDRIEDLSQHVKVGEELETMITNVDRKTRSINLSIKAKDSVETAEVMQRMQAESGAATGTTNLGALLRAKLDSQRDQ